MWIQTEISLAPKPRGFHLVTDEIERQISDLSSIGVGWVQVFIKHTSASLTINENADPTVRGDLERHFNKFVPERAPYYEHDYEGDDDMPAHIKSCILGASVMLPISSGRFNLGIWQGIYLCEHRNRAGSRQLVVTINGEAN
ncbi:secondary thiamine-phosphate synthase enzyme YjbQ [Gilvimarinus sp. SDUM040013]|uniref:Secondary thiamine-phosphate synthase enzyme YjbQ n=1 Tax=Gilvimarinus gilvus TaxID=3058038 RepID=A0ABU4RVD6_9GAMM|nr:secondary thiamine-phosphate synthase enzyme YjbQ [Gilvimarinus sp. SDUM040013]MDO3387729.1 secondary thiamine-phosphate synthase enzyme YjbQ [Gilvimarinus sp. SDUM040013]MDX6848830.1 secondary thiamine-phosphate synthase enzyme YjbQ [Gilvimarinus sp. SDUM040013]